MSHCALERVIPTQAGIQIGLCGIQTKNGKDPWIPGFRRCEGGTGTEIPPNLKSYGRGGWPRLSTRFIRLRSRRILSSDSCQSSL